MKTYIMRTIKYMEQNKNKTAMRRTEVHPTTPYNENVQNNRNTNTNISHLGVSSQVYGICHQSTRHLTPDVNAVTDHCAIGVPEPPDQAQNLSLIHI